MTRERPGAPAPLALSRIGLGCVTFGREIDEAASLTLLDHASARGVTHFDTAAAYANGASEKILGRWLATRKPAGVTVATKLLPPFATLDLRPSLRRLGVDRIDLLYLHRWDETAPAAAPELRALLDSGVVRALGVSNVTAAQLRTLEAPVRVVQNNHNLAVSDLTPDLREHCAAQGIALVTYSPLGAGFLTGKHRDGVQPGSRFSLIPGHQRIYFQEEAFRRLARLEDIARRSGRTPVELALAWALRTPGVASTLIGGRVPAHLDQAFAARDFDDPALLAQLNP